VAGEKFHPAHWGVLDEYQKIKDKFTDPETKKVNYTVFRSFYVMLEKLRRMNIPFTIILRTFGSDLPEVVEDIAHHN